MSSVFSDTDHEAIIAKCCEKFGFVVMDVCADKKEGDVIKAYGVKTALRVVGMATAEEFAAQSEFVWKTFGLASERFPGKLVRCVGAD